MGSITRVPGKRQINDDTEECPKRREGGKRRGALIAVRYLLSILREGGKPNEGRKKKGKASKGEKKRNGGEKRVWDTGGGRP